MRLILAAIAGLLFTTNAAAQEEDETGFDPSGFSYQQIAAAKQDPKRFTIDPATVEIEVLGPYQAENAVPASPEPGKPSLPALPQQPSPLPLPMPSSPLEDGGGIDLNLIINTAKQVWQFIVDNKPVVDVSNAYANAIPSGIEHWSQLSGWSAPKGTLYGFSAKNGYGIKVIDVRYLVLRTVGGSYNGKGKYLNHVTVEPLTVDVYWGYKFNMSAAVPSVANVGSSDDPLASMILNLKWSIDTVIKHSQGTSVYHVQGDGLFREIGGPFRNNTLKATKEKVGGLSDKLPKLGAYRPEGIKAVSGAAW